MEETIRLSGNIVDVTEGRIYQGTLVISAGRITEIIEEKVQENHYLIPGFIDSHVHIESSMLVPSEFARLAVVHGTVACVSDPHEIANVLGIEGIQFMIENGSQVPFHFFFGAPSCVPATPFETSGSRLGPEETSFLLSKPYIHYLSEMMNFPGVISKDPEVMEKIALAKRHGKVIDGHAPGLRGDSLLQYAGQGITTDHECYLLEEALEKVKSGMKILIREGSAAKNFDELIPLMSMHSDSVMLCSDDKHPDDLVKGHINLLAQRAVQKGYDRMKVLRSCSLIPAQHYHLPIGLLRKGDPANVVIVNNLNQLEVISTWIQGNKVAEKGNSLIPSITPDTPNRFVAEPVTPGMLEVPAEGKKIKVIEAFDGQLITKVLITDALIRENLVLPDIDRDILKLSVMNRYESSVPALGFVKGFGLKKGALASTVSHDSHNLITVGTSDEAMARAMNLIIESKGGISVTDGANDLVLPLPVAGIMSPYDGYEVARSYQGLDKFARILGCILQSPFMTLSFMALLVIPSLKLSDKGLFDGSVFRFTSLFEEK